MPTQEEKETYLLIIFYGVCDSLADDVNPYSTKEEMGRSLVSSLNLGSKDSIKRRTKRRIAQSYHERLLAKKVILPKDDILKELGKEKTVNETVSAWADIALFELEK